MFEYPFKTIEALRIHTAKHKKQTSEIQMCQKCGICGSEFVSNNEFRSHIKVKHTLNFNCDICDFQGSSKIILTKHTNLKHRTKDNQEAGTLRCTECEQQFSSKWSLNNHNRDRQGKIKLCRHFQQGKCRFTDKDCWDKHEKESSEKFQCSTCGITFKSKNVVMLHRKKEHPEKVQNCRNQENCTQTTCWYKHETSKVPEINHSEDDEWVLNELDNENMDFQEAPMPPKPPLSQ